MGISENIFQATQCTALDSYEVQGLGQSQTPVHEYLVSVHEL